MEKREPVAADPRLIAACGLYCGACRRYLRGSCPGCRANAKASWCGIRTCVRKNGFHTCADCTTEVTGCGTYSNFMAKVFAWLFNSDRPACIRMIKERGERAYAAKMATEKCQTIKRKRRCS